LKSWHKEILVTTVVVLVTCLAASLYRQQQDRKLIKRTEATHANMEATCRSTIELRDQTKKTEEAFQDIAHELSELSAGVEKE
jgi:uncharacterized protein HemX